MHKVLWEAALWIPLEDTESDKAGREPLHVVGLHWPKMRITGKSTDTEGSCVVSWEQGGIENQPWWVRADWETVLTVTQLLEELNTIELYV